MNTLLKAKIRCLSDVQSEEVRWLWKGRIPLGKLTFLNGDPGTAKTTVALDLMARVSQGHRMPDRSESDLDGPRGAVILTAEDGLGDTIKPRLEAAGADITRIVALEGVGYGGSEDRLPTISDVGAIREAIEEVDAAVIVLDPMNAYLGDGTNSHRDASVRRALTPFVRLLDETGVAALAIRHLNKNTENSSAMYRGLGSIGLTASARSDLIVGEDPDDDTGKRRVLAPVKCNLTEPQVSLAYEIETGPNGAPRIAWLGPSPHSKDDLINNKAGTGLSEREQAKQWLEWVLADGPVPSKELRTRAEELGHAWRTVRRAMDELGVEKDKDGMEGGWSRVLPEDQAEERCARTGGSRDKNLATFGEEEADNPHDDRTISKAATSGEGGHLRHGEEPAKTANEGQAGQLRESPEVAGISGGPDSEDGQGSGEGDGSSQEARPRITSVPAEMARWDWDR